MMKKIAQNNLGLAGFIFIAILLVFSVLGYLITPDATPKSNDIHLEIALQKPGFKVQFLKQNCKTEVSTSFFTKMFKYFIF